MLSNCKKWARNGAAAALMLASVCANATVITSFDASVSSTDPTQLGRISRNGVPQDWANDEAFGGLVNTTTRYNYHIYDLDLTSLEGAVASAYGGYVQIEFDSTSANTFLAAYLGSYDPTSAATMAATWLGDPGTSGNYFGTDPLFFQVYVPQGAHLLLVLNTTAAGTAGLNQHGTVTVEAFMDTEYTDLPEPGSLALTLAALAGAGCVAQKRKTTAKREAEPATA